MTKFMNVSNFWLNIDQIARGQVNGSGSTWSWSVYLQDTSQWDDTTTYTTYNDALDAMWDAMTNAHVA